MDDIKINSKDKLQVHLYSSNANEFYALEIKSDKTTTPLKKFHARAYEPPREENKRKILKFLYGINGYETRKKDANDLEKLTEVEVEKNHLNNSPANYLTLSFQKNTEIHIHHI
ncbi:MAG: hypothetical protein ACOC3V_03030 [bacterium]